MFKSLDFALNSFRKAYGILVGKLLLREKKTRDQATSVKRKLARGKYLFITCSKAKMLLSQCTCQCFERMERRMRGIKTFERFLFYFF